MVELDGVAHSLNVRGCDPATYLQNVLKIAAPRQASSISLASTVTKFISVIYRHRRDVSCRSILEEQFSKHDLTRGYNSLTGHSLVSTVGNLKLRSGVMNTTAMAL